MPSSSVAILLFTRSAGEEAAHKQFLSHGGRAANAAVAAQLIAHAAATARRAGVDFIHTDSAQQVGATFGERLAGAMHQAFGHGYEHLLVIGNDCPQLTAPLLRQAVAAVRQSGAVLGPATDGGVYLLGLSRARFAAGTWARLPWQTHQLGAALRRQLLAQGADVCRLPTLADVDTEADLARVLGQPLADTLQRRLRRLRARRQVAPGLAGPVLRRRAQAAQPHRGPPAC
jgi:glycosyltransferase A (GT-A) superfamily protein (DUF2064 family)